ncbi:hypothetical protein RB595_003682 [Gaeumannomyces hyphopodioides]
MAAPTIGTPSSSPPRILPSEYVLEQERIVPVAPDTRQRSDPPQPTAVQVLQISDTARDCRESFSQLLDTLGTKVPVTQRLITEYQQRYDSWVGYLGVFAQENLSLDHRLRNSPEVKSLVVQQLHIAKRNLNAAVELVSKRDAGIDQVAHLVEEDNVPRLLPALKATFAGIEGALDRLHRLGAAIRQASAGQLTSRAKHFAGDERLNSFELLAYSVLDALYPAANPNLLEHICKSLAEKYQRVLYLEAWKKQYRQVHSSRPRLHSLRSKLRAPQEPPKVQSGDAGGAERSTGRSDAEGYQPSPSKPSHDILPSVRSSAFSEGAFNRSYQPTLLPPDLPRRPTASIGTSLAVYTPPQILLDNAKYADCRWCFRNYPAEMFNAPASWREHQKEDWEPYVCLSEDCAQKAARTNKRIPSFVRSCDWQKHMEKHSVNWSREIYKPPTWVCSLDVDPETSQRKASSFASEADFLEHLQKKHPKYTSQQQQRISRHSTVFLSRDANICPLCCFSADEDQPTSKPETGVDKATESPAVVSEGGAEPAPSTSSAAKRALEEIAEDAEEDGHGRDMSAGALQASRRMAKHVADHLHTVTFLVIRLHSLPPRDDDDDDQNAVSINPSRAETSVMADSDYQDLFAEDGQSKDRFLDYLGVTDPHDVGTGIHQDSLQPGPSESPPPVPPFPDGVKVLHDCPHATVDICFVHGLTGDRDSTWTADGQSTPWPGTLLPQKLKNARILTYGYDAYVLRRSVASNNRLNDHAKDLLNDLTTDRASCEARSRPLIFVAHSLGGLVCKGAMLHSRSHPESHLRDIFDCTKGIIFMGTPHKGSWMADWGRISARAIGLVKSTNESLLEILETKDQFLESIQGRFLDMIREQRESGRRLEVTCFFEELPLSVAGTVVSKESATFEGFTSISIYANHRDMVRFSSMEENGFKRLLEELSKWVAQVASGPDLSQLSQDRLQSPSFSPSASFGSGDRSNSVGQIFGTMNTEIHLPPERPETPPQPFATIPFSRDPDFVNRGDILDQLRQRCFEPAGRVALVGLGGIGKSQLAIEFAHRTAEETPNKWIFWVHAGTQARVEEGFRDIADAVKLPGRNQPKADIQQLVYGWLSNERNGRWTIVLDSADDENVLYAANDGRKGKPLASYFPQSRNGSIVVTTRNRGLAYRLTRGYKNIINIEPMVLADALLLLEKKLGPLPDTDTAKALVQALDLIPLAIRQAAAYIQARSPLSSVGVYLAEFYKDERKRTRLLGHDAGDLRRDGGASNAILTTWQISFEHIRSKKSSAADLLALMSFFDPQGIALSLLEPVDAEDVQRDTKSESGGSGDEVDGGFQDDVAILRDFCLVFTNEDGSALGMYGLVQLSTRKWLEADGLQNKFRQLFVERIAAAFPTANYSNWATCRQLFAHVEAAIDCQPTEECTQELWAGLMHRGGWYALEQGRYRAAERMAGKEKRSREKQLGKSDEKTLASAALYAETFRHQGRWEEAEKLEVEVMEMSKTKLGVDHPLTLTSMANLASTYRSQGRWQEAEKLNVEVMEARKIKLGTDHPDTLTSMANLAFTWKDQGRWEEAEKLNVEVMGTRKAKLGTDHPDTLTSMANLASTYMDQGRWQEAEKLNMEVMEIRKTKLGTDHPDTLTSVANLASTYRNQGRWQKAEKLNVEVMEARKIKLGADHPDTLTSMNNLAFTWKDQGRHAEALALIKDCTQARQRVLGPNHPHTLSSLSAVSNWSS